MRVNEGIVLNLTTSLCKLFQSRSPSGIIELLRIYQISDLVNNEFMVSGVCTILITL